MRSFAVAALVAMGILACGAQRPRDAEVTTISVAAVDGGDAAMATSSVADASAPLAPDAAPFVRGACGLDSGHSIAIDRWRPAIEGYASAVQPANQVVLGAAIRPFAVYLSDMHKRIHPYFSDRFLASFAPPSTAPKDLVVRLEIVLAPDGAIRRVGVVKASGVTAFDVGALESVACAAPYGETAPVMRSPDENVYVHWEFHSDPVLSCSTVNVHPYLLRAAP